MLDFVLESGLNNHLKSFLEKETPSRFTTCTFVSMNLLPCVIDPLFLSPFYMESSGLL